MPKAHAKATPRIQVKYHLLPSQIALDLARGHRPAQGTEHNRCVDEYDRQEDQREQRELPRRCIPDGQAHHRGDIRWHQEREHAQARGRDDAKDAERASNKGQSASLNHGEEQGEQRTKYAEARRYDHPRPRYVRTPPPPPPAPSIRPAFSLGHSRAPGRAMMLSEEQRRKARSSRHELQMTSFRPSCG